MGRKHYLIIAIFLTTAIFVGSLFSGDTSALKNINVSDKAVHSIAYFLLALSWFLSFCYAKNVQKTSLLIATLVIIYGIIIEVSQSVFTDVRTAELSDILANSVGVFGAMLFFNYLHKKRMLIK